MEKNIFVKVSGDRVEDPSLLEWIKELSRGAWVVICVGGGTQINEEFSRHGFPIKPHGPMGREMDTFEERQAQRNVLERVQSSLQDRLIRGGIRAAVEIPVVSIGTVLCPANGDQMVRAAYLGFDELYVVTTPEREEAKKRMFADLPKVSVKTF